MSEGIPDFDLYDELEVARSASAETIAAAYRSLAKRNHPDAVGGAGDRIKRLNLAFEWLGDPIRRVQYDNARARRPPADRPAPQSDRAPGRESRRQSPPSPPADAAPVNPGAAKGTGVWVTLIVVALAVLAVGMSQSGSPTGTSRPTGALASGGTGVVAATPRITPRMTIRVMTTPRPTVGATARPTPALVFGVPVMVYHRESPPLSDGIPVARVTILEAEPWDGNQRIRPHCEGCGLLAIRAEVDVVPDLGQSDERWCWPTSLDITAVGRDGSRERLVLVGGPGPALAPPSTCFREGDQATGWITIYTGPGFVFDHLDLAVLPWKTVTVRP